MLKVPQELRGSRGQKVVHYDVMMLELLRKKRPEAVVAEAHLENSLA